MKFLVTGGRGFIGSHFVEEALEQGHEVIDIDKMTYAASRQLPWDNNPNYRLEVADISEITHLPPCDVIVNFAAESFVDRSINDANPFLVSNIRGTYTILDIITKFNKRMIQISTDEVFGSLQESSAFETSRFNRRSCSTWTIS